MLSNRLSWEIRQNPLLELYNRLISSGVDVINLSESNPTLAGLDYNKERIEKALLSSENFIYRPDPRGLLRAREAVCAYYQGKGISIKIENIFLTASTSEAYSFLFKLLCSPGDSVLIPKPGYPLFEYLSSLEGIETIFYRLEYVSNSGWEIDFHSMERAYRKNTKAIILINPNNPTGSYIKPQEMKNIIEFCRKKNLALIVDEVFIDFILEEKKELINSFAGAATVGIDDVLIFTLSGISKILGLPQMKLGWIITRGPEDILEKVLKNLEIISDTYLSVSTPIQNALPEIMSLRSSFQEKFINRLKSSLNFIKESFKNSPFQPLKAGGGWTLILEVPKIISEEEWALRLLEEENCFTYPGYFFDFEKEAFLSISLILQPEKLKEGINRIKRIFKKNK